MGDDDNFEEYSWSIDPDIVRLADECARLRAELADARHKMAQADIDTMHAKAELAAMTARKDGWRRVARKYREMWLVHFSGALMDQMGIEDPNDPDLGER